MDEVAEYNKARWKALAEADALFTRPKLDLDQNLALVDQNDSLAKLKVKKFCVWWAVKKKVYFHLTTSQSNENFIFESGIHYRRKNDQ